MLPRPSNLCFAVSLVGLSWFGMMAVHEAGHAVAAFATGGQVEQVVLHPATISRTDVSPNPRPDVVVWAGPLLGVILPLVVLMFVPRRFKIAHGSFLFFAGFCLIANGAYIAIGAGEGIGDSGEMLRTGSPAWLLILFGTITVPAGLLLWHRLGSPKQLLSSEGAFPAKAAWLAAIALAMVVLAGLLLSPR